VAEPPAAPRHIAKHTAGLAAVIRTNDLRRYPAQVVNGNVMVDR